MNALKRRQWLNIGLLGLVSGSLALVFFDLLWERPLTILPLLDPTPAPIGSIVVERIGQERLAFERRVEQWWMTAPQQGLANPALLDPILRAAEMRCLLQYSKNQLDLKQLQLDSPQLRLRLDQVEIRFGATAPTDGQRYLQVGDKVHLCPDNLYRLLTSAAGSFLAPSLETLLPVTSDN